MKSPEQLAKEYLEQVENLRTDAKHKPLVELIKRVRAEKHEKTRHACAEEMMSLGVESCSDLIDVDQSHNACMNCKSL